MTTRVIEAEHFDCPKKLLKTLDPADGRWKGWIFRGQRDSSWELLPSVWRNCNSVIEDKYTNYYKLE